MQFLNFLDRGKVSSLLDVEKTCFQFRAQRNDKKNIIKNATLLLRY